MNALPQIPPDAACLIRLDDLDLEPLAVSHAEEMYPVLSDARLHEFTGGEPPLSVEELTTTYSHQVRRRSPDGQEIWLNWVVRERSQNAAIGFVQATIEKEQTLLAWVIGREWQGKGFGGQAARGLVAWLEQLGVPPLRARVNPDHVASQRVAERAGLSPSGVLFDGEEVWGRAKPATA